MTWIMSKQGNFFKFEEIKALRVISNKRKKIPDWQLECEYGTDSNTADLGSFTYEEFSNPEEFILCFLELLHQRPDLIWPFTEWTKDTANGLKIYQEIQQLKKNKKEKK